ncbi:MAG: hydantoinase/oxoprolinase family protein [Desulfobacteraceae bacterium]|jgi:N-methylhydantoinase A/oxoprolinase/acetone carboxylase beta subunit
MIIGLDVGGTHTDVVLIGKNGPIREIKVTTDSTNLFATVLSGLEKITAGIAPEEIRRAVLSTTLTTNAIIQKKSHPVGMIVSAGPGIDPSHFKICRHYYTVSGAIDHRGREIKPINKAEIKAAAKKLQDDGIEYVAVVSKFSVRNPEHELAIAKILEPSFKHIFLGHHFSGNLNFPRRINTAYLNASAYPLHKSFWEAVKNSLEEKGLNVPIRILKPDGGNMRFESAIHYPAQSILSGPAASIMGAIGFAPKDQESLVLDIGGTTTDMAILKDGVPLLDPLGIEIDNFRTLIRSLQTHSIGVGGDSVVRRKKDGVTIGPDREGMAMAYGGFVPTPTDALFVLGMGEDGKREKSVEGIAPLAKEWGISVEAAADKIFTATCKQILNGAHKMIEAVNSKPVYTVHELYEGIRINPTCILILGGPAPYFKDKLAALSGLEVRVVPRWKVANAIGAALARTTCEVTLFADTEQGIVTAPGENFSKTVPDNFTKADAVKTALKLLKTKAIQRGANPDHLQTEVIEEQEFNMVRGFHTSGKNIRIKVQVKPGLIHGYDPVTEVITGNL